jgi:hypothetical protein
MGDFSLERSGKRNIWIRMRIPRGIRFPGVHQEWRQERLELQEARPALASAKT